MQQQAITLGEVRYDQRRGTFQARVDVVRDGRTFRYPCEVQAPETTDRDWVAGALADHALRQSDTRARPRLH